MLFRSKLYANFENQLKAYIGTNYVYNNTNDANFRANDFTLPNIELDSYWQYELGIEKVIKTNFSIFANANIQTSGLEGYGGNINLKWNF